MKYWMLACLQPHWPKGRLKEAKRIAGNRLLLRFDQRRFLIDLSPGSALVVPDPKSLSMGGTFSAPFDVRLHKRLSGAELKTVALAERDKVLSLSFIKSGGYKTEETTLILELTGRHTNAILTDASGTILEALHHIRNRIRHITPQSLYRAPPPLPRAPKLQPCEDIEGYLRAQFIDRHDAVFEKARQARLGAIQKRIDHFQSLLKSLPKSDTLQQAADQARLEGSLILANLKQIPGYAQEVALKDFEGHPLRLSLEGAKTPQQAADQRFHLARRLEAKARGVFRESASLSERLKFYESLHRAVVQAPDMEELKALSPDRRSRKSHPIAPHEPIEYFEIEGFRVALGRNERGNALLLSRAKANDLWLHLQGLPSTHVLIQTNRQNIPIKVIERAARLCVQFSVAQKGDYLVDYTPRRYVRIVKNAQVNYTHQKTVAIAL
jgi:predicted ribosome quality control (RQC) complex YloA/Tae2 family protein